MNRRIKFFRGAGVPPVFADVEQISIAAGSGKFGASCYCPDNNCIYYAPWSSSTIGKFNVSTQTMSYIPFVGGSLKYASIIYAFGKIYALPFAAARCFVLDPVDDSWAYFGDNFGSVRNFYGAALSDNGMIYGVPWDDTHFCKIDPVLLTAQRVGTAMPASGTKYSGLALVSENLLVGAPRKAAQIVAFDASIDDWSYVGTNYGGGKNKWITVQRHPNGKAYFCKMSTNQYLEYDPATGISAVMGAPVGSTDRNYGFALAPNGFFYTAPGNYGYVDKFDPLTGVSEVLTDFPLSGSEKYLSSPILAPDNSLYCSAFNAANILKISNIGSAPLDAFIFPSTMVDFHLSNWNIYQNRF